MKHPLASLFDSRPESVGIEGSKRGSTRAEPSPLLPGGREAAVAASKAAVAVPVGKGTAAPVARTQAHAAAPATPGTPGGNSGAGVTVLAVQEPPTPDGMAGAITFAPHLSFVEKREVAESLAWFDRSDARRKLRS